MSVKANLADNNKGECCPLFPSLKDVEYSGWKIAVCRLIPIRFEVLFPVLRPRTAVVIGVPRVIRRQLGWPAVHVLNVAEAFDIRVPAIRIVHRGATGEAIRG